MKFLLQILFLLGILACSKATSQVEYKYRAADQSGVAAKVGDIEISMQELNEEISNEVYKKELEIFDIKFNRLNSLLVEKLIKKDPKSKGLTNDQYLEKYIVSEIKISKNESNDFMEKQGVPEDQRTNPRILERVNQFLKAQKKKEALEKWLAVKTKGQGVDVYFQKPVAPSYEVTIGDAPYTGGEKAKVTIVEFSDFQCPYCAKAASVLNKVKKQYGNKIKIVFKHFPLSFHNHAKSAALASMCAFEQDKKAFWKMHDAFFLDKAPLGNDKIKELAANSLKLEATKFNACLDEKKYAAHVERDLQQGQALGVKGTPSVYINGQVFVDTLTYEKYVEKIEELLK